MLQLAGAVEVFGTDIIGRNRSAHYAVALVKETLLIGMLATVIVNAIHLVAIPIPVLFHIITGREIGRIVHIMAVLSHNEVNLVILGYDAFLRTARHTKHRTGGDNSYNHFFSFHNS